MKKMKQDLYATDISNQVEEQTALKWKKIFKTFNHSLGPMIAYHI